jgi:hypothetical protein
MSLVIDNVRSEDDELWICAGGAKPTLYIVRAELSLVQRRHRAMLLDQKLILQDLRMPAKEVSRSHNQQCAMVFRQKHSFTTCAYHCSRSASYSARSLGVLILSQSPGGLPMRRRI